MPEANKSGRPAKTLTIVIPTFNRALLMRRLLLQLISQSRPPDEIIVVDDHSTDPTAEIVKRLQQNSPYIRYVQNSGRHLADARRTGLELARSDYISFIDDDVIIDDSSFFTKLYRLLQPDALIQPKVIMENLGQRNHATLSPIDIIATRPWPILEAITARLNRGSSPRPVFPFNELGVFWHRRLNSYWHDPNLIGDAYGQSYSTAVRLLRDGYKIIFYPDLVLRHSGAPSGGSRKFTKKLMTDDFTPFHYDYFYNMIYLHSRFFPRWIWLWLPFYVFKSLVALSINRNFRGWREYAIKPIRDSLRKHVHMPRRHEATGGAAGWLPAPSVIPKDPDARRRKRNWSQQARKEPAYEQDPWEGKSIFIWQGGWHGGAERITFTMAQHLAKKGCNVTLGVYKKNPNITLKQIVFPHIKLLPQSFRSLAASLVFRSRHAHHFTAVYAHTLGAWKKRHNKLFVHEAADLDRKLKQMPSSGQKIAYMIWRWLYLHLCLNKADSIFAATPACADYLKRHHIPAAKIESSASFYDEMTFRFVKRPTPTNPLNIIFIGNPQDKAKNFSAALKLANRVDRFRLHVVGGTAKSPSSNVIYHGYLSPPQVAYQLSQADIFFMPSASEGFSIALLEALATGIPCLVNQTSIPSLLTNIRNLVGYRGEENILPKIQHIIRLYHAYNVPDPALPSFAQSRVIEKESTTIIARFTAPSREAVELS